MQFLYTRKGYVSTQNFFIGTQFQEFRKNVSRKNLASFNNSKSFMMERGRTRGGKALEYWLSNYITIFLPSPSIIRKPLHQVLGQVVIFCFIPSPVYSFHFKKLAPLYFGNKTKTHQQKCTKSRMLYSLAARCLHTRQPVRIHVPIPNIALATPKKIQLPKQHSLRVQRSNIQNIASTVWCSPSHSIYIGAIVLDVATLHCYV